MGIESGGKPQPFRPAFQQFEPGGIQTPGPGSREGRGGQGRRELPQPVYQTEGRPAGGSNALPSRRGLPSPQQSVPGQISGERPRTAGQENRAVIFAGNSGLPGGAGRADEGSGLGVLGELIGQRRLNVGDIGQYYDSWLTLMSETAGNIPQSVTRTIRNISLGLGFLFYNQWDEMGYTGERKQAVFQKRLERWQQEYNGQLVLPYEEGLLLKDAAAAVNVVYDSGTPEEVEKRTFRFAELGKPLPQTGIGDPSRVIDAEQ